MTLMATRYTSHAATFRRASEPRSFSAEELGQLSAQFEHLPASAVVAWARDAFGGRLVLASSFQDCVLIDIVTRVDPDVEVVFLDTGYHFSETLRFVQEVRARYRLNLRIIRPLVDVDEWPCGSERCCEVRKVEPMGRALEGKRAWMTGVRRAEAPTRSATPILGLDESRGLVKVNPLAGWTDRDVAGYVADHDLPTHPLINRRYLSIGCAPTTGPVVPGADPRSGRWSGSEKTECGLHT